MSLPLVQQGKDADLVRLYFIQLPSIANAWTGHAICYIAFAAIYYTNAWNVIRKLPLFFIRSNKTCLVPVLSNALGIYIHCKRNCLSTTSRIRLPFPIKSNSSK